VDRTAQLADLAQSRLDGMDEGEKKIAKAALVALKLSPDHA
jgi:hypothetical protein